MEAVQTATFETVWAILEKNAVEMEKLRESQKETERQMKEDRAASKAEFNERIGKFTTLFGEMTEYMVAPGLREKFKELGFIFPKVNSNSNVRDYDNNIFFEVDVMLE
ncbi:MAG: hypothetical protein LBH43_19465, partial [Treponema sp.]|nr:hypothetical protein [Treponema sp.]